MTSGAPAGGNPPAPLTTPTDEAIAVADEKKTTGAVNELCPIALSAEDFSRLQRVLKREREREVVRSWLGVIGRRAKEWAIAYVAIGTAIVAGREQIAALLHWLGFGGGK